MEYTSYYTGAQIDAAVGKLTGTSLEGVHAIELNLTGTLSGFGGFIDFHYNGSSSDYTSRIIEKTSGVLSFDNNITVQGNSMFATNWGNVDIGTESYESILTLWGHAIIDAADTPYITLSSNNYGYCKISCTDEGMVFSAKRMNDTTFRFFGDYCYIDCDTEIYGVCTANSFNDNSDMRKKDVISNITVDINDIANAPLFKFTWKDERKTDEHVGSSAQYWQGILPEAISVGKDPMQSLSMNYGAVALASAITTAKSVVDHEERIAALEKENALLKKEIEAIKAA